MYGGSNFVEAWQDIYYGSIGDIDTVAFNPIRDTVFCGNQELYDIWGTVSTTSSRNDNPLGTGVRGAASGSPNSSACCNICGKWSY